MGISIQEFAKVILPKKAAFSRAALQFSKVIHVYMYWWLNCYHIWKMTLCPIWNNFIDSVSTLHGKCVLNQLQKSSLYSTKFSCFLEFTSANSQKIHFVRVFNTLELLKWNLWVFNRFLELGFEYVTSKCIHL